MITVLVNLKRIVFLSSPQLIIFENKNHVDLNLWIFVTYADFFHQEKANQLLSFSTQHGEYPTGKYLTRLESEFLYNNFLQYLHYSASPLQS